MSHPAHSGGIPLFYRLPQLGQKVILDEKARGVLPLLQLDGTVKEVTR